MKDRILASSLRRKFEGHPEVQRIAGLMTDEELVEKYREFSIAAVKHVETQAKAKPLATLYGRALAQV